MPTKSTTKPAKAAEAPAATKPPSSRARKPKAAEPDVSPSLGGATEALPAVDPILPPIDLATKRASKAAATAGDNHPSKKAAAKATEPAEPKGPRTTAVTEGTQECRTCGRELGMTKFPTKAPDKDGVVQRDTQCRECREKARLAKLAAK